MNFKERYNHYLDIINKRTDTLIPPSLHTKDTVRNAMCYSLSNGGKRIRPVLVLDICRICGEDEEKAADLALALECVHTYSLIHDDLPCMDNDDMRRGKPSCHVKYGYEYALLAGDGLLTFAFEIIAKSDLSDEQKTKAVMYLSRLSGYEGMIAGQEIDLLSEGKSITYDELKLMHSLKTGCLIKCCAYLGTIAGKGDEQLTEKLCRYCEYLGLAFQIEDDILDVCGNEWELGKPVGSDAASGKTTYITLFGLEKAKQMAKDATASAIESLNGVENSGFLKELAENLLTRKS